MVFEVDNKLWYFTADGLKLYPHYGEVDDVLKYGNTVEELLAINGIAAWIGKDVYPIIALEAPRDAAIMPKLKLGLKVNCFNDEYTRDEISNVFELKGDARILNITYQKVTNGYGKVTLKVRLRDSAGEWSDWIETAEAADKPTSAVQFKATYTLSTLDGSDESKIFDCKVEYITDKEKSATNVQEIFAIPLQGTENIGVVRALIKHSELQDAEITASVKLFGGVQRREGMIIGRGLGATATYYLGTGGGIDPNIDHNTLRITADGVVVTNYYYDTANATVQLQAANNAEIRASYNYGGDNETWIAMEREDTQPYGDIYMTRFYYRIKNPSKQNCAVKFTLTRKSNEVLLERLGVATGKTETYLLPHRAKAESISMNGSWSYDEDAQLLKCTHTIGEELTISYDWVGIMPQVIGYVIGAEYSV